MMELFLTENRYEICWIWMGAQQAHINVVKLMEGLIEIKLDVIS